MVSCCEEIEMVGVWILVSDWVKFHVSIFIVPYLSTLLLPFRQGAKLECLT
jgi:hypothetical protein